MDLPALTLTDDGRIANPATGEVLDEAAAADALAETLRTYARAKVEADALAMRMSDTRENMIAGYVDAKLAESPIHQAQVAQLAEARAAMAAIQASLDGLFAARDGRHPVKVDMGDVMVSWGKARETVTLAHPASWYAGPLAWHDLVHALERAGYDSEDVGEMADTMLAWLSPTTKTSELPGASITVRAGKGGGR